MTVATVPGIQWSDMTLESFNIEFDDNFKLGDNKLLIPNCLKPLVDDDTFWTTEIVDKQDIIDWNICANSLDKPARRIWNLLYRVVRIEVAVASAVDQLVMALLEAFEFDDIAPNLLLRYAK